MTPDNRPWLPICDAPYDGTEVEVKWESGDVSTACWSERPVCMGGPTVYREPSWATGPNSGTDRNLPLDEPQWWREIL